MNYNIKESAKEQIIKIMLRLKQIREDGNSKKYRTVMDALERLVQIYKSSIEVEGCQEWDYWFFDNLKNTFEIELRAIDELNSKNLSNENYLDYREWVLSYQKITILTNTSEYIARSYKYSIIRKKSIEE